MERALGKTGWHCASVRTAARYTAWCEGQRIRGFPASYLSVAGFVAAEVKRLHGSTKSTANTISGLKIFSDRLGLPWLTSNEVHTLNSVRRQLVLEDVTPIRRMQPLTLGMLQQVAQTSFDYKRDPYDLLCLTMAMVAHNGLLRGGELLCGIKMKDLQWEPRNRSVTLHIFPTKTERRGAGVYVRLTDYPGLSAYKLLKRWVSTQHMQRHPEHYLFPFHARRRQNEPARFDFRRNASRKWFTEVTRRIASALGCDARLYSNHSYRAGGATDLFISGVPYPQIKKYGRWRSEAALVYLRDDVEVSTAVAYAFGRGCNTMRHMRAVHSVGVARVA